MSPLSDERVVGLWRRRIHAKKSRRKLNFSLKGRRFVPKSPVRIVFYVTSKFNLGIDAHFPLILVQPTRVCFAVEYSALRCAYIPTTLSPSWQHPLQECTQHLKTQRNESGLAQALSLSRPTLPGVPRHISLPAPPSPSPRPIHLNPNR